MARDGAWPIELGILWIGNRFRAVHAEAHCLAGVDAQRGNQVAEIRGRLALHGEDLVPGLEPRFLSGGARHHPVDDGREVDAEWRAAFGDVVLAVDQDLPQFHREVKGGRLPFADDFGRGDLTAKDEALEVGGLLHRCTAEGQHHVAIPESNILEGSGEGEAVGEVVHAQVAVSPDEEDPCSR